MALTGGSPLTAHVAGGGVSALLVGPMALVALGTAYAVGLRRLWRRVGTGRVVRRWQAAAHVAGLLIIFAAIGPPLDAWADSRLSGHMVQHLLLVAVAPPLVVLGATVPTLLRALPAGTRRRLGRMRSRLRRSRFSARWVLWLTGAVVAHLIAIWAWHLPAAFQAAAQSGMMHAAQHASFLGTAVALWWVLLVGTARSARSAGVFALFAITTASTPLGLLMTLSSTPWYPIYGTSARAVEDQQLAGSIMWGYGGAAAVVGAVGLFASWLAAQDRAYPP